jgi:hypothetical protein
VSKFKSLSAIVLSISAVLASAGPVYACPVSSAYRYVLLDAIPSKIPEGAIVLTVESQDLEQGSFGTTNNVSKLNVKRVVSGEYDQSKVDLVVAPFSSCTRGNESEGSTVLVGYVRADEKQKQYFFPVQYIGAAHRRAEIGDLDRVIMPEDRYVERALRALAAEKNNDR